jgi:hypothetical protein
MIDVSKIRVGDEVTVRGKITGCTANGVNVLIGPSPTWAHRHSIATHTPKPREFKPGDRVTWSAGRARVYEFIAQRGPTAILWSPEYGATDPSISSLRHADESE